MINFQLPSKWVLDVIPKLETNLINNSNGGRSIFKLAQSKMFFLAANVAILALTACGTSGGEGAAEIRTLSTRADMVSGGDALIEIVPPPGTDSSGLTVQLDGRDITAAFAKRADGRITGLVTGLVSGDNQLVAKVNNSRAAQLTITHVSPGAGFISGA